MDKGISSGTTTDSGGPELWDARRTAKALGISERALWDLSFPRGKLPVCRLGRAVRYRPLDIEAFIASQVDGVAEFADQGRML